MQKHFPGKKVEEYRRMLGLFGVSGDLALQQVNTFLLYTQKCCSKICKKGQKNIRVKSLFSFHQEICSFLSNHWYICFKMALKLKFWWNFLITLNLAFWGNHANFWNYTFFQFQSTMLDFLCTTVFPFGRKRNKPMCYIITYWRNV